MGDPLALYVHWPYCARICPYCDFNVYRDRGVDTDAWRAAFLRDLDYFAGLTPGRSVGSVYFGGGTPSLMAPSLVAAILDGVAQRWSLADAPEVTLEANPTDAEIEAFEAFARAGVNRLSLGVQRFDDASLVFLGRNHDAAAARAALSRAMAVFDQVSFDLIYGLPDETPALWRATLREAIDVGAGHLSLYQLTVEPGTAFDRAVRRGTWSPVSDDAEADFYAMADDMTRAAGLAPYEISNHARPGAQSRHNLTYWRGSDYIGIGPGAHGRITIKSAHGRITIKSAHGRLAHDAGRVALEATRKPAAYLAARDPATIYTQETLTPDAVLVERLAMGLRLVEGIVVSHDVWRDLAPRAKRLEPGYLSAEPADGGMRLTLVGDGRFLLNAILRELIA